MVTRVPHAAGRFNAFELGTSLGVADTTVSRYVDILAGTFMVRRLTPWFENIKKRQIKTPKIYFRGRATIGTRIKLQNNCKTQCNQTFRSTIPLFPSARGRGW